MDDYVDCLINELLNNIDKKDLKIITRNLLDKKYGKPEYISLIKPLLELSEEYYDDKDFGFPGAIFQFIISYNLIEYEKYLLESIQRKPNLLSVQILAYLIGIKDINETKNYLNILKQIANKYDIDKLARMKAIYYVDYFSKDSQIKCLRNRKNEVIEKYSNFNSNIVSIMHNLDSMLIKKRL
jgi:hypothetical protein